MIPKDERERMPHLDGCHGDLGCSVCRLLDALAESEKCQSEWTCDNPAAVCFMCADATGEGK